MQLTAEEHAILEGAWGPAAQSALQSQISVGEFFGARQFVPVTGVHMMGDMEVMGTAGYQLLEGLAESGARCIVPTTTNARCVDFVVAERLRQDPDLVAREAELIGFLRRIGVMTVDTCINYQTVYQPRLGERVAWGDTGTVIYANSVLGARTNYESGPAALAAALTGRTPAYGFHLDEQRRGSILVDVAARLDDLADWGALGAVIGQRVTDYWAVPVLQGLSPAPVGDQLKHLGASLASYGSLAMFHIPGATPEAPTLAAALGNRAPNERFSVTDEDIEAIYRSYSPDRETVDLVVLTGPQLSLFELRRAAELLEGRRVHPETCLIVTTNASNREAAARLGYVRTIEAAGGMVLAGVCWYLMAPGDMRQKFGWRNVLTNSAKVANIIGGYRYHPVFRRTTECIQAAVDGRFGN